MKTEQQIVSSLMIEHNMSRSEAERVSKLIRIFSKVTVKKTLSDLIRTKSAINEYRSIR